MADTRARLCVIPVRAGSKGLTHKNIRPFLGRPLLAHSVEQAKDSGCFDGPFDCIAVSSDSPDYLDKATAAGATDRVERPAALASDTAGSIEVLLHALEICEARVGRPFDTVCLLQATSPLRRAQDIADAIATLETDGFDSVLGVMRAKGSPYATLLEPTPDGSHALSKQPDRAVTRRQDLPPVFQINGAVYVWQRAALMQHCAALCPHTGIHRMSALRSIDIDDAVDWAFAELAASLLADDPTL
jgi:CMP-N-acetylneuraminic acid synthetase